MRTEKRETGVMRQQPSNLSALSEAVDIYVIDVPTPPSGQLSALFMHEAHTKWAAGVKSGSNNPDMCVRTYSTHG